MVIQQVCFAEIKKSILIKVSVEYEAVCLSFPLFTKNQKSLSQFSLHFLRAKVDGLMAFQRNQVNEINFSLSLCV